jgi:hypothetical protein
MTQSTQNSINKDAKIKLEIKLHEYKFLTQTIKNHKKILFMLKINEAIKSTLMTDMNKITSIMEKSEMAA